MKTRTAIILTAAFAGCATHGAARHGEGAGSAPLTLRTVPAMVYKVVDGGNADTESWFFNLLVHDPGAGEDLLPQEAVLELYAADTLRERTVLPARTLASMRRRSYAVDEDTHPLSLRRLFTLPETFDLRFAFHARPTSWRVDRVRILLDLAAPGAGRRTEALEVPLQRYVQRTGLVFPISGPAIVTQGPINNAGHSGHSNQFAVDVMGLNDAWGPIDAGMSGNDVFAGWGRDVRAPAAGRIVYARNDVPDNPAEGGDPAEVFGLLSDPLLATAGNAVVIDHGTGEFSALMHLQEGSVAVREGEEVSQGQVIGRIGNSGDSFGAHLHYQLQDGPDLFRASSLPVTFTDLQGTRLVRGVFFEASPSDPGQ